MLAKIAVGILIVIGVVFWAAAMIVYATGVVFVELHEKTPGGHHLYLPVPVALAHAVIMVVPKEELREAQVELAPRKDLILAACKQLQECPDASFFEYTSAEERVTVVKDGRYLVVNVDSKDEKVKVSIPVDSVRNLVWQLAD